MDLEDRVDELQGRLLAQQIALIFLLRDASSSTKQAILDSAEASTEWGLQCSTFSTKRTGLTNSGERNAIAIRLKSRAKNGPAESRKGPPMVVFVACNHAAFHFARAGLASIV